MVVIVFVRDHSFCILGLVTNVNQALWNKKHKGFFFFFFFDNQYAAQLRTHCGCVRWVVLLPLRGCLGVNGSLTMKDVVSSHIWEQVASQGDFTAWSMAPSPQLTARQRATVYNFDSSSERITQWVKGCNCTVYLQKRWQFCLGGLCAQIDVHSLQAQRNICFAVTVWAADVTAVLNQLSHWDDKKKRVKPLQCGHQNGALTRLSPLFKCHFYNHASTVYSEMKHTHGSTTVDRAGIKTCLCPSSKGRYGGPLLTAATQHVYYISKLFNKAPQLTWCHSYNNQDKSVFYNYSIINISSSLWKCSYSPISSSCLVSVGFCL